VKGTDLLAVLGLGDHLSSDLDPGLQEALLEVSSGDLEESGGLLNEDGVLDLATFITLVLLEGDVSEQHTGGHELEDALLLLIAEVQDNHSLLVLLPQLNIILRLDLDISVGEELVVVWVDVQEQGVWRSGY